MGVKTDTRNAVALVADALERERADLGDNRDQARAALRALVDGGYMDDPKAVERYGKESGWSAIIELVSQFKSYGLSCFRPGGRYVAITGKIHVELYDTATEAREALSKGAAVFDLDDDRKRLEFSKPASERPTIPSKSRRPRRR